ncbi:hypothetical protein V8C34DRAFT_251425 [Trichoderma compactum]
MGPGRELRDEAHELDVEPTAWRAVAMANRYLVCCFLARSPSFKVGELPHYAKFLPRRLLIETVQYEYLRITHKRGTGSASYQDETFLASSTRRWTNPGSI